MTIPATHPTEPLPSGKLPPPDDSRGTRHAMAVAAFIGILLFGCAVAWTIHSRSVAEGNLKQTAADSAALPVNVIHPTLIATTEELTLPASAQAFQEAPIYARTSGYLKSWTADIGTHVKAGQVLAEIETPEVDRQLEQAKADLKNAQANLELSQITATRSESLLKTNTISHQERDQATSDLAAKRALVDAGEANVKRLEQLQSFEKVFAPFDGVITARNTDVGALISTGDTSGGKELFHLVDNRSLRVYFSVPEILAANVHAGEKVPITFDAFPGEKFEGTLVRDSAAIDPRTHTLNAEADIENPTGRLFSGSYAVVHLKLPATQGAVVLPANTLLFREEGPRVAVVRDGKVALVPINIGRDHGNTLEVLGALKPADQVILDPPDSMAEGAAVKVEKVEPAK